MVVLLAFAESKTASTTTLGLDFPTVWDQTPHRFGLLYYGLDWSTRMEFQSFITIDFVRFHHGSLLWWFVSHFYVSIFHFCSLPGHWTLGVCLSVSLNHLGSALSAFGFPCIRVLSTSLRSCVRLGFSLVDPK